MTIYLIEHCPDTSERYPDWSIVEDYGYFTSKEAAEARVAELKAPQEKRNTEKMAEHNKAVEKYKKKAEKLKSLGGVPDGGYPRTPYYDYSDYAVVEVEEG